MMAYMSDDEDFMELVDILQQPERQPQVYRERENHFVKWNDNNFLQRFRFSKNGARYIINQVSHLITSPTERNHALTAEEKVLMTLRFYATGSFLQVAGDFMSVDKATACRHIWQVTQVIAGLYDNFIKMPVTQEEMQSVSQGFYDIARFPKCIGAIDCTHIRILSPGGNDAEIFRNRKAFFSYNVQGVCDSNRLFQDVVCRWPGSSHDSTIFLNSSLRVKFERGDFNDNLLVGDSGYAVKTYMMPPLENVLTPAENLYNESQIRTRNRIEQTFGIWKRRFPILSFGIRMQQRKIEGIVIATAVLHNIGKLLNEPVPLMNNDEEAAINFVNNVNNDPINRNRHRNVNNIRRLEIINYFNGLL